MASERAKPPTTGVDTMNKEHLSSSRDYPKSQTKVCRGSDFQGPERDPSFGKQENLNEPHGVLSTVGERQSEGGLISTEGSRGLWSAGVFCSTKGSRADKKDDGKVKPGDGWKGGRVSAIGFLKASHAAV